MRFSTHTALIGAALTVLGCSAVPTEQVSAPATAQSLPVDSVDVTPAPKLTLEEAVKAYQRGFFSSAAPRLRELSQDQTLSTSQQGKAFGYWISSLGREGAFDQIQDSLRESRWSAVEYGFTDLGFNVLVPMNWQCYELEVTRGDAASIDCWVSAGEVARAKEHILSDMIATDIEKINYVYSF